MTMPTIQEIDDEDVFRLSKDNLLVVVFAKTNSPYFSKVLGIASGATRYMEQKDEKSSVHTCVFGRSKEQAARAIVLLRFVESWATVQVFVGGRLVTGSLGVVLATLECFQTASACLNPEAHCLLLTDQLFKEKCRERYGTAMTIQLLMPGEQPSQDSQGIQEKPCRFIVPCRRVFGYEKIEREHPASWQDQVQAIAVQRDVDWCPFFDLSKFRQYE